jgi:hypothetical protein
MWLTQFAQEAAILIAGTAIGCLAGLGFALALDRDVAGAALALFTVPIGILIGLLVAVRLVRNRFD